MSNLFSSASKRILGIGIIVAMLLGGTTVAQPEPPAAEPDYPEPVVEPTRLIIGVHANENRARGSDYHGASVARSNHALKFVVVETFEPERVRERAARDPNVRFVEQSVQFSPFDLGYGPHQAPNDPRFAAEQPSHQLVRLPAAWDATGVNLPDTAVCVVDTGFNSTHQDLAPNWVTGTNTFADNTDLTDINGHGTHVAGIAAAAVNNGLGISGAANLNLYGVRASNAAGKLDSAAIAEGIQWCADMPFVMGDARGVISLSLGGWSLNVKIKNEAETTTHYDRSILIPKPGSRRFSIGTAGWSDPGSNQASIWVDDLSITRVDGTTATMNFAVDPGITESTQGGVQNAMDYDSVNDRLRGFANSANTCPSNYESINIGGAQASQVKQVKFKFRPESSGGGDGSWWDLFVGMMPDDNQNFQTPNPCTSFSGTPSNFAGFRLEGNGDTSRRNLRTWGNHEGDTGTPMTYAYGTTYVAELTWVEDSTTFLSALNYATTAQGNGRPARLVVAASGNDGCVGAFCLSPPAKYAKVVSVGSVGTAGDRAASSNGGPELDVVAPGTGILSTCAAPSTYCTKGGTSMAAPLVAGMAGLAWHANPSLDAAAMRSRLNASAMSGVRSDAYGYGLVDARCLLDATPNCQGAAANVKVFDATGNTLLHRYSTTLTPQTYNRFSVATAGWSDPDTSSGEAWIDDLTIERLDGTSTTNDFASDPGVIQSTTGDSAMNAVDYDATNDRLKAFGNTGYVCFSNYESINVAGTSPITKARFKVNRNTQTGDGSWWDLYVGLMPNDSQTLLRPSCSSFTGVFDNMVGLHIEGSGDTFRRNFRGYIDGAQATSTIFPHDIGTTYWVEITFMTARTRVYDGASLVYDFQRIANAQDPGRFAVATVGWNDPDNAIGRVLIDDLVVDMPGGIRTTNDFSGLTLLTESETGNTNDAVEWTNSRLEAKGNSGYACSTNYESMSLGGSAIRTEFTFNRPTALSAGDASWWDLYVGLVPHNHEAIIGPSCTSFTGTVDDLIGLRMMGDGQVSRTGVKGRVDSVEDAGLFPNSPDHVYRGVIEFAHAPPTNPVPPASPAATRGPGIGQISLTWQPPPLDGGAPVTGYEIWSAGNINGPFTLRATVGPTTSFTDSGLGNGVTRFYYVRAINSIDRSAASDKVSATTFAAPSAPQNVQANAGPSLQQITVSWNGPATNGGLAVTSFTVYRSVNGGGFNFHNSFGPNTFSFVDSNLSPSSTYAYRLTATNAAGEGALSASACDRPHPAGLVLGC